MCLLPPRSELNFAIKLPAFYGHSGNWCLFIDVRGQLLEKFKPLNKHRWTAKPGQ